MKIQMAAMQMLGMEISQREAAKVTWALTEWDLIKIGGSTVLTLWQVMTQTKIQLALG